MKLVSLSQEHQEIYSVFHPFSKIGCFSLTQFIKPIETKFVIWGYKSRLTCLEIKGNLMSHYHKHTYFEMGVRLAGESSTQAIGIFRVVIPRQRQ